MSFMPMRWRELPEVDRCFELVLKCQFCGETIQGQASGYRMQRHLVEKHKEHIEEALE